MEKETKQQRKKNAVAEHLDAGCMKNSLHIVVYLGYES